MVAAARSTILPRLSPFALRLDEALRRLPSSPRKFLAACSGGPDSVALVHALHELSGPRRLTIEIAHVNHHLRGRESRGDQAFVERLGGRVGWRVHVLSRPVPAGGNLEEQARDARYQALCALARLRKLPVVLTAHTMDDQAETVLMNLLRGAGLDGLAGMRPVRVDAGTGVTIARPLLFVGRSEVLAYLAGKNFRMDRSNRDTKFLRNYVRINLFESLTRRTPGFQERIARLAELVRQELPVLEKLAEQADKRVGRRYRGGWLVDRRRLEREPLAVQRRVLRKAAGRDLLTFDGVERLRTWMATPSSGRIWQLRKGWVVERLSKSSGSPSSALFWFRQVPSNEIRKKGR
jgi:tRNA(Ile)-lysidine synthase